ncbi:MAG: outer membrane beta-barrel protein [Aliifodinibius sp.]|nr:acyloxyacyl hydrolase [Fodinibius sp.]NIV12773.1 outer membrane beta-barrel protein [Fodinibius sp.]NIX15958.1 outer membrane beta-barrel protein [Candidatus Dadabacteria bacterium]NIY26496.1 outer membrane beta-barrel protein [Fodinibius sp.]
MSDKIFITCIILFSVCSTGLSQTTDNIQPQESDSNFTDRLAWVNKKNADIHEMNFIIGYSFASTKGFWGQIPKATLSIYTLRYNRKLVIYENKHLLEYTAEANLAANYTLSNTIRYQAGSYSGFGIAPLGFQFNFNQYDIVQPFLKSSTGFMYFKKPFPDNRGVQFNFTLELGAGVEIMVLDNLSLSVGYKYHHLSNGQQGEINPGVDSNIFYTGVTIF